MASAIRTSSGDTRWPAGRTEQLGDIIRGGRAAHESASLEWERPIRGSRHRVSLAGGLERRRLDRGRDDLRSSGSLLGRRGISRAQPERRERPLLADLKLSLSRELERGRKGGGARGPPHLGIGAGLKQEIVEGRPVGLSADETGQRLARLGERPDIARLEAYARQRVSLGLPGVRRQQVIEAGLVCRSARGLDRFRLSPGEEVAAEARPGEQELARLANRRQRAQARAREPRPASRRPDRRPQGRREAADEISDRRARRP